MKVLVVEDEPLIRLGIASLVEEMGFAALDAASADEALVLLERDPEITSLITDVDMPGSMDGIGLGHLVHSRWPAIAIIVISGKIDVDEASLPPGSRFFSKPLRDGALFGALSNAASAAK